MSTVSSAQCSPADAESPCPSWCDAFVAVIDDLTQRLRSLFSSAGFPPASESPDATAPSPNPTGGPSQVPRVRFTAESVPVRCPAQPGTLPWMPAPIHESASVAKTLCESSSRGKAIGFSASTLHPVRPRADHHPISSTIDGKPILRPIQSPPPRQSFPQPQPPEQFLPLRGIFLQRRQPQSQSSSQPQWLAHLAAA